MLIVETGAGLANADSLTSLEFASAYHEARGNVSWAGFNPARQEQLLRNATDYITYIVGPSLASTKLVAGQRLPFPRTAYPGVPLDVQEATAELALLANTTPLVPNETTMRKKSVKVGPITVEYDTSSWTGPRFTSALSRFAAYMATRSVGMTARLVRT